jgi:hypothetical protein
MHRPPNPPHDPNRTAAAQLPTAVSVDEAAESFCIRDVNGQALAYVYFEDKKGRRTAYG